MNKVRQFERTYEDEYTISVWKYDLDKTKSGPISVTIKHKKEFFEDNDKKTMKDYVQPPKKRKK